MLRIQNLTVKIEDKVIFHNLNFEVKSGESVYLKGANGSGKTSLFRAILGISVINISQGKILFNEINLNELAISDRVKLGLGLLHQNPPKFEKLTLKELLSNLKLDDNYNQELIQDLKLERILYQPLNQISGGEQKRSELLQVLALKPKLLLLDELDSGVDEFNLGIIVKVLSTYQRNFKSAFIATSHHEKIIKMLKIQRTLEI